jgi:cellulose synthase/poly-beta-1,6-N-acetylglucosamine synthase-like glycosyltransferase
MTVSIIIAVKTWQKNLEECVGKCCELDYPDYEIIILPDSDIGAVLNNAISGSPTRIVPVKVIPTGAVSPAKKRDLALAHARGEILAFLDDDAYPNKDWLKNALKNFTDSEVVAVGGPAVTPENDSLRQRASGKVFESFLVSGKYTYRYLPEERREVDDFPSCNFLVRKSIMQQLGGFNTDFWPGEDTKLCLDITKKLKKKIIYDPAVLVYHHRRPIFMPHLKQIASYALHRGYFVKNYPQTSLRIFYFLPSLFLMFLIAGGIIAWFLGGFLRMAYLFGMSLYLFLVLIFSINKELRLFPLVFLGIILTHLTYGFYFFKGLLSSKLKEENNG